LRRGQEVLETVSRSEDADLAYTKSGSKERFRGWEEIIGQKNPYRKTSLGIETEAERGLVLADKQNTDQKEDQRKKNEG